MAIIVRRVALLDFLHIYMALISNNFFAPHAALTAAKKKKQHLERLGSIEPQQILSIYSINTKEKEEDQTKPDVISVKEATTKNPAPFAAFAKTLFMLNILM